MKQNVVIWRFHDEPVYPALVHLQQDGIIDIKAWFGDRLRCSHCTHEIFELLHYLELRHEYRPYDSEIYRKVYPALFQFIRMYSPRNRLYYSRDLHDYIHMFNILFVFFYHLLKENDVHVVLFGFIPHQGPEFVLYELAKAMDIKTVMVLQSADLPNRFFFSYSIEDFSEWKDNDTVESTLPHIPKEFEKKLVEVKLPSVRFLCKKDMEKFRRSYVKAKSKWRHFDLFYEIQWRVMVWKKNREYRQSMQKNCQLPDFSKNYVYFPLHFQPELTTEVLGGIFDDQVLAIERLHDMLPAEWYIYVKDYPRLQTAIMRPTKFFARLKALPKVKLVPTTVNTYDLIKHSRFVATITGSAGWEAISGGKCALVFGQAWYKSLPGVFSYNEQLSLEDILSCTIDHQELQEKLGVILGKTAQGIVDPHHTVIYKDYSDFANHAHLETFFRRVLSASASH